MLTKGWDSISLVCQNAVNSGIAGAWPELDHEFSYTSSEGLKCYGEFSCWSVIDGGGGKLLRMSLPICSGFFEYKSLKESIAGMVAIIEVTLSLIPKETGQIDLRTVFLRKASSNQSIPVEEEGWVRGITLLDPKGEVGPLGPAILDCICSYLIENPDQFTHTFAQINFAKADAPKWARPRSCAYAYLDSGYLSILAVTTDRSIAELPLDIDVSGIGSDDRSCYILSSKMVLENLILPGLLDLYQDATPREFAHEDNSLLNIPALRMQAIKSGAIWYTPVVFKRRNQARIIGDVVSVDYLGDCSLYAGIVMKWSGEVEMLPQLKNNVITFVKHSSYFRRQVHIPWYLFWISPVASVIAAAVSSSISDDLISAISARGGSINAGNIDCVSWTNGMHEAKESYLAEALVVKYL